MEPLRSYRPTSPRGPSSSGPVCPLVFRYYASFSPYMSNTMMSASSFNVPRAILVASMVNIMVWLIRKGRLSLPPMDLFSASGFRYNHYA